MHTVDTCADDDSPGSLRAIIASPNTVSDDTIDLSQLTCSTISLDSSTHTPAYIAINQAKLHLLGPGRGILTISGGGYSGVFRHLGGNLLEIDSMTIANGGYASDMKPFGGCIYSTGSVVIKNSNVERCIALGTSVTGARGGGVYARNDLTLDHSSVTSSAAYDLGAVSADGGGVYVGGNLQAAYATISNNYASGQGGGAVVNGISATISSSTVSSNQAAFEGGLYLSNPAGAATIIDSTISANKAITAAGALYTLGNLKVANSTIVLNHDHSMGPYAGVFVAGASLVLDSSILAGNGGALGPADLSGPAATTLTGAKNLIVVASGVSIPADTIHLCPQLDPLADNGGPTLTHAIRHTSPAVDAGDPQGLTFDQTGYLRTDGIAADIGAFEWRTGTGQERVFVGGFDGLCDQ